MIAAIALPAFFLASGLFAVIVLVSTWQAYAAEFASIRRGLHIIDDTRQFHVRVALTETHDFLPVARRSGVRASANSRRHQPRGMRAAA